MDFSAGDVRWIMRENDPETPRDFAIGLHAPGRFDRILDIDACLLQSDKMNKIFGTVRKWAKEYKIPLNNPKNYTGFLRSCMIRQGYHSGEIMVNIVTRKEDPNLLQPLIDMLTEWHPDITSCVNNITDSKGDISRGDREILLFGDSVIHDRIGDLNYEISANAFFQTNTRAAEILYSTIADFADLNSSCVIWDLYCGTGSIAMYLSKHVKKVYGFELVAGALRNATRNAAANKIENCEFYEANLDKFVQNNAALIASLDKPDIAIVDPPRSGLNPKFLNQLVQLKPRQIIYVSCNPASQARDLDILSDDYNVLKIQPVDMFPHTPHIETVAKLELIK